MVNLHNTGPNSERLTLTLKSWVVLTRWIVNLWAILTVDVHLSALFPRILWIVDSTIRSRRFDKIYDFFVNLWMLSASPRKFWCRDLLCAEMEGARERARERERERERREWRVLWFSSGCAPEDLMDEQQLTLASFCLGLGLGFTKICESG